MEALLDGVVADGLRQMGFAHGGRPDEEHVGGFADEPAGGQVVNDLTMDAGVELPVKVFERLQVVEVGGLRAALEQEFLRIQPADPARREASVKTL